MSNFQYNWQFTYKVEELVPAFEKKLASMKEELAEFDQAHQVKERDEVSQETIEHYVRDLPRGVREVILRATSNPTPLVVRKAKPSNTLLKSQIAMCERILRSMKREDPHRQYRLVHSDLEFLDL